MSAILDSLQIQSNESPTQFAAFREFVMMGVKRSYVKVAKKCGLATSTIERWALDQKWTERLKVYEQELTNAFVGSEVDLLSQNRDVIQEDMLVDYNEMLTFWREQFNALRDEAVKEDAQPIDLKDIRTFIQARQLIDDMGRRTVGLPNTITKSPETEKPKLPTGIIMPQLGSVSGDEET